MALKTGRASNTAYVYIEHENCTLCGLCVQVCKGKPLYIKSGKVQVDQSLLLGCIGCGHCAAVCPQNCITIEGRTLSKKDFFEIPSPQIRANYAELFALMTARRSIREFQKKEVEEELINKIISAIATAPMGLPPSDVELLVIKGHEKVQSFATDIIDVMSQYKWMFSSITRTILRPFLGKEYCEISATFIEPVIDFIIEKKKNNEDWLFYNAPLVMYFHVSPYADPVDPMIAATYAMLAAEALGLGTCMIGTPAYLIKYNKKLKNKYSIPLKNQQGVTIIIGYPAVKYKKAIKRTLGDIKYI